MIWSASFVAALALLAAACGSKSDPSPPPATAGATFVNGDLGPLLAQVEAAIGPLATVGPTDASKGVALGRQLVTARSYLAGFLVGASKVSPPTEWKPSVDALVAIVTELAGTVDELQMAVDGGDTAAFTTAHEKLAGALKRHAAWKTAFATSLATAHITQAPLPAPPAPTTPPPVDPTPQPCGGPCPCTDASIVKTGDVITRCNLSRDYGVSGVHCGAGPVRFDEKTGELAECTSAAVFTPYPPEAAGTPGDRVVLCGTGPVTKAAFGVESCILEAPVVVGPEGKTTTIAKTAHVYFAAPGRIVEATMPDGTMTCFRETGVPMGCK